MSTAPNNRDKKTNIDEVLEFVQEYQDPAITANEVAEQFDVTSRAARYRLDQLTEEGLLTGKKVGSSAKIWFPTI
jgi:predicted ArsR family transcriptional regulator